MSSRGGIWPRLRHAALVQATLTSAAGVIPVTTVPVLYPKIVEDVPGFTVQGLGLSTTLCFAVISVTSPFAGRLTDLAGPRRSVWVIALGLAGVLVVLATARSASVLIGAVAFSGVLHATAAATSNVIMGRVLDGRRPATLFGLRQAAVPMVAIAAGAAVATLGGLLDWRSIVLLFAAVPALLLTVRPGAAAPDLRSHRQADLAGETLPLPRWELLILASVSLFSGIGVSSVATFGVATLTQSGLAVATAGVVYSAASALGLTVRLVAGFALDRFGWSPAGAVAALLAVGCGGALVIATGAGLWVAAGVVVAYGFGWGFPGVLQFAVVTMFRARIGSATGLVQFGSATGVSTGPMLFAGGEAIGGLSLAWAMVAVSWAVAASISVLLRSRRGETRQTIDGRVGDA